MSLACGECGGVSPPLRGLLGVTIYIMYAREKSDDAPSDAINLCVYLEVCVIFPYLCTRKRNERPSGDAGSLTLRDL